jgi:hypothetical protein
MQVWVVMRLHRPCPGVPGHHGVHDVGGATGMIWCSLVCPECIDLYHPLKSVVVL